MTTKATEAERMFIEAERALLWVLRATENQLTITERAQIAETVDLLRKQVNR